MLDIAMARCSKVFSSRDLIKEVAIIAKLKSKMIRL